MSTVNWDESKIRRDGEGKFASRGPAAEASGVELSGPNSEPEGLDLYDMDTNGARTYREVSMARAFDLVAQRNPGMVSIGPAVRHGVWHDHNSYDGFDAEGNRIELNEADRIEVLKMLNSTPHVEQPWTDRYASGIARLHRSNLPAIVRRSEYVTDDDLGGPDTWMKDPRSQSIATSGWSGSNPERESVGDPGHCEVCAQYGHVAAHPDHGCGDVGCHSSH